MLKRKKRIFWRSELEISKQAAWVPCAALRVTTCVLCFRQKPCSLQYWWGCCVVLLTWAITRDRCKYSDWSTEDTSIYNRSLASVMLLSWAFQKPSIAKLLLYFRPESATAHRWKPDLFVLSLILSEPSSSWSFCHSQGQILLRLPAMRNMFLWKLEQRAGQARLWLPYPKKPPC